MYLRSKFAMPDIPPPLSPPSPRRTQSTTGFTLIELLVVVGVIVLMMGLAIPAFNAIRGGTDFTSAVYSISGALQEGRAYAMANNTYVLVGFDEVSAAQNASASPQVSGTGRLAIAIVASKDGTRPYQSLITNPPSPQFTGSNYLTSGYGSGTQYTAVTKLIVLTNIHMVDLQSNSSQEPTSGGMVRPWHGDNIPATWPWESYCLGDQTACQSANCFVWPLGSSIVGSIIQPQYVFSQVVEFDPQGSARILVADPEGSAAVSQTSIPYFIEIGLEPANGSNAPSPPEVEEPSSGKAPGQIVALQVDGMTGATRTYRP
jgi:Tfp pilus assembly protein FimT